MPRIFKPSAFLLRVFSITGASVLSAASGMIFISLIANGLGEEKFGVYSLSTRLVAFFVPFATLNLGIALIRYLSTTSEEQLKYRYLLAACILSASSALFLALLGCLFQKPITQFFFHDEKYQSVFLATLFLFGTHSFYSLISSYHLASGRIFRENCWQLLIGAIGPLLIALFYAHPDALATILSLQGFLYALPALPFLLHMFFSRPKSTAKTTCDHPYKQLLQYGMSRFSGRFALAGLLCLPPMIATYYCSLKEAGYLVAAQSVFRLSEMGTGAFNLVAFPKFGLMLAENQMDSAKQKINDIGSFVCDLTIFATFQLLLWSDLLVVSWLGVAYIDVVSILNILVLAVGPYLFYIMLSPVIEVFEERAINTLNLCASLLVSLACCLLLGFRWGIHGIALGSAIGFFLLGILTIMAIRRIYNLNFRSILPPRLLLINIVLLLISIGFKQLLPALTSGMPSISLVIPFGIVLLIIYYFMLRYYSHAWTLQLECRIWQPMQ